jgi:hypothetical protein
MNKGQLIGGSICLGVAIVLGVLQFVLPAGRPMFMVGDRNMPWVPPVILGSIGVLLLATARRGREREPDEEAPEPAIDPEKAALNKRLETVAWGLFLVMLGGFLLVKAIPSGYWSIGVGLILLGLNLARHLTGLRMSGFTTVLGVLAILGGVLELTALKTIEGAVLLIVLGAYVLLKPWLDRRALFGRAEEA